jgi:hypothetical protein
MKKRFNIYIDLDIHDRLTKEAKLQRRSRASLFNHILDRELPRFDEDKSAGSDVGLSTSGKGDENKPSHGRG